MRRRWPPTWCMARPRMRCAVSCLRSSGTEADAETPAVAAVRDIGAEQARRLVVHANADRDRVSHVAEVQVLDRGTDLAAFVQAGDVGHLVHRPPELTLEQPRVAIAEAIGRECAQQVAAAERGHEEERHGPFVLAEREPRPQAWLDPPLPAIDRHELLQRGLGAAE